MVEVVMKVMKVMREQGIQDKVVEDKGGQPLFD